MQQQGTMLCLLQLQIGIEHGIKVLEKKEEFLALDSPDSKTFYCIVLENETMLNTMNTFIVLSKLIMMVGSLAVDEMHQS